MKKLFILIFAVLSFQVTANAAIEPHNLIFEHDKSGKYIYCNNREFIFRSDLADNSIEHPRYIMNNEDLTPDKYAMFISHVNHTDVRDETTIFEEGFDIEVDVVFRAKEDTVLKITAVGFEVPKNTKYYLNGEEYTKEEEWGCFKAWATYMGVPVSQMDSGQKYLPEPFEPVEITIPAGEKVWLSSYIPDYSVVPYYRPVNIMTDFEIVSGSLDANVAALRATGTLRDRSRFIETADFGPYFYEHQHKGISESLNNVTAELNYTVDDWDYSGTLFPVTVYNQLAPEGKTVTTWYTNLNPRADYWNKDNVAESCMLSFEYKDDAKLKLYGDNVPEDKRDNVWRFDTSHSDIKDFPGYTNGFTRKNFIPNFELRNTDTEEYAANLGNYGVFQNYKISVTNNGNYTRYINYILNTTANNLIIVRDENGNIVSPYPVVKGSSSQKERDIMASIKLPSKKTTTFTLTVVLTTNYVGGMENRLELSDIAYPVKVYESAYTENVKDPTYTGREYIRWENNKMYKSSDNESWTEVILGVKEKQIFSGRYNSMKIVYTGTGYMAKSTLYDGIPYYGVREFFRDIYFFDENFKLIQQKDFGIYPFDISAGIGNYYVKAGGIWHYKGDESDKKMEWEIIDSEMGVPVSNYSERIAAYKNGKIYLSENGIDFYPVRHYSISPEYIDSLGDLYYFIKGNTLYLSKDGIYFETVYCNESISKIGRTDTHILINDTIKYEIPEFSINPIIFDGKEYIEYAGNVTVLNEKPFIPVRDWAKLLGYQISWDNEASAVILKKDSETLTLPAYETYEEYETKKTGVLLINGTSCIVPGFENSSETVISESETQ